MLIKKQDKLEEIKKHLNENQGVQAEERVKELEAEITEIREVIACLN